MKKRIKLICHNDKLEYSHLVDVDSQAKIIVECPYCRQKGVLDLHPDRTPFQETMRGEDEETAVFPTIDLTAVFPTTPLEE